MKDNLLVKTNTHLAGKLVFEQFEYIFSYTSENSDDFISLTMPLREKSYVHTRLHPIFEMHLPEGYLLSIIKKHFAKLVKTDDFGLLNLMAPSIYGRVTYESQHYTQQNNLSLENLIHPKNEKLFDELVERFALNSPLSGVQPKVLARVENKATLKLEQYIVKSWGEDYKELAINEYFCMRALQQAKIPTPEFYLSDDDKLFIMKRFDIKDDGNYLGFEDMCVLQARQRDEKYEGSYEKIAKTIATFVSNKNKKTSLINFFKMIVLNNILENGDAHLKNFGLLYDGVQEISLAPAYDVISTTLYIKNDVPALHLLGSKKWWDKKFIIRFGMESCNLTKREAHDNYDLCVSALLDIQDEITLRLQNEKDEEKLTVLKHLLALITKAM